MAKIIVIAQLVTVLISLVAPERFAEVQRYDGWYNNLAHANWGSVGSKLHRKVRSAYSDGVYMLHEDRPSARAVSDLVFHGPDGLPNSRNSTAMMAFFSQLVAYEIMQSTEASCPLEMFKIPIKKCDRIYDEKCNGNTMMPFFRAKYDKETGEGFNSPREQINEKTSWIDGSFIYSTQVPWINTMRSFTNGTLREGEMSGYPPLNTERLPLINPPPPHVHKLMDPERLFLLGDPRVNENPALLSIGLMFYRWHNVQARRIQKQHPNWSDNQIFDRARQWVIATLQNVVFYEFLPAFLNTVIDPYQAYNPEQPPGISHVFSAAAFRYPHTLIPPGMFLRNGQCRYRENVAGYPAVRFCNTWWNAQDIVQEYTVDELILGMVSQIAERDDNVMVSDLREFVFGPMFFSRRDLGALTIMRGRDNGLPDYNSVRRAFHMPERNWTDINPEHYAENPELYEKLRDLYNGDISHLDVYVGGMLERSNHAPGELFSAILKEQFYRIRSADRFWFENRDNLLFSEEEIAIIRNTTLHDIIVSTTSIEASFLQKNVFFWKQGDPCPQPFQLNSSMLEPCIKFMRYDHFLGNEIAYIFTCIFLGVIPLICAGIGYLMIRHRKKYYCCLDKTALQADTMSAANNNDESTKNSNISADLKAEKFHNKKWQMPAVEWLHERFSRSVLVTVGPDPVIMLSKRRGGILRHLSFETMPVVHTAVSDDTYRSDQQYVFFTLPSGYDLVLRFESKCHSGKFLMQLEQILRQHGKFLKIRQGNINELLETAETLEKRQKKLEQFFREAYAKAFNLKSLLDGEAAEHPDHISESVLNTSLTKSEFADALGMKDDDVFIQRMFNCVARKHPEKICFQEFLDTVVLFSKGTMTEKLQIMFKMCDPEDNGAVDRREFCQFLASIFSTAGSDLSDNQHHQLVDSMLTSAGILKEKPILTYKDFEALISHLNSDKKPIGLHVKGRGQAYFSSRQSERESLNSFSVPPQQPKSFIRQKCNEISSFLEDYRQHITCLVLFFCMTLAFFFERYWHYSEMSEHRDLRRVMGLGIAITRGAAAAISFSFSVLLLTVCRNVITKLRDTPLNQYIPFDAAIVFHKIVALVALFFSAVHTVGHCINFYHIGTQAKDGLDCLFQEAVFSSDTYPSMTYWFYCTVTGITGILLVVVLSIMYVFAAPSIISNAYYAFRVTHWLHILLYVLILAHGLPKLLDKPKFWYFLIGPLILFIIDRIITLRQKYKKLEMLSASLLASDVTYIQFKRPRHFHFRSGQWVRISCPAFKCNFNELHSYSLASAPQESTLEIYAKAQGPWSWKLRQAIQECQQLGNPYPVLHMDGPYGGGNQDWYNYDVSVMVGGGIGITPYASMLLDLAQSTSSQKYSDVVCKKVYFLWICPTHRNFEWFIDVLRRVEQLDTKQILEVHIFITQFFHKFDLRTTMLYISEKHFQCIQQRSMFTGLRAANHFGRPNMTIFLKHVQQKHENLSQIGIFSCGPGTLNRSVREACEAVNKSRRQPHYVHRYETF